nr:MAG TPA: hypothetical protein [Caudoviricetes sp.]
MVLWDEHLCSSILMINIRDSGLSIYSLLAFYIGIPHL